MSVDIVQENLILPTSLSDRLQQELVNTVKIKVRAELYFGKLFICVKLWILFSINNNISQKYKRVKLVNENLFRGVEPDKLFPTTE